MNNNHGKKHEVAVSSCCYYYFVTLPLLLAALLLLSLPPSAVVEASSSFSKQKLELRKEFRELCGKDVPPLATAKQAKKLSWLVLASGEQSVLLATSAQHEAACWMLYRDPSRKRSRSEYSFLQRYALATFYFATRGPDIVWEGTDGRLDLGTTASTNATKKSSSSSSSSKEVVYLQPWLSKANECDWYGVACNNRKQVVKIEIGFHHLAGLLPRELFLLKHLREIDLHGNDIQGVLPYRALIHWKKMERLRLDMNSIFGSLHSEFKEMTRLKELSVYGNYMAGTLPSQISQLTNLEKLDLFANNFKGTVPSSWGTSLKKLRELDIHENYITGTIPQSICDLKLDVLVADCLGPEPEMECKCCTICCRGLPDAKCIQRDTGEVVIP